MAALRNLTGAILLASSAGAWSMTNYYNVCVFKITQAVWGALGGLLGTKTTSFAMVRESRRSKELT